MAYSRLIENISFAIETQLNLISTRYNFDLGDEFELGLCELLSDILPAKYGVCRGFVVTEDNSSAGDDIIVYDRERFPTLRILGNRLFTGKQEIPVEAVYCYIEAKHTLYVSKDNSSQNVIKAFEQVHNVKSLPRDKRALGSLDPYNVLSDIYPTNLGNWPGLDNPLFTAIISRFIKDDVKNNTVINVSKSINEINIPGNFLPPDLVILGKNDLMFPAISDQNSITYESPFFIKGVSTLIHKKTKASALAIGLTMLLYALDTIKLGKMPFNKIIKSQLLL